MANKADLILGVPLSMEDDPTTGGNVPHIKLVGDGGASVYDDNVGAIITVLSEHHEVHQGEMFVAFFVSGSVSNNNSIDLLFSTTGTAKDVHFVWQVTSGGDSQSYFYENATGSGGTNFVPVNVNRTSSNLAGSVVRTGPTVGHVGTLKSQTYIPGGKGGQTSGGLARTNTEWILAPSRVYLIRATNVAGTAQTVGIDVQFYEE